MNHRRPISKIFTGALLLAGCLVVSSIYAAPQHTPALQPTDTTPHRTRLFLQDGSYPLVMRSKIARNVVRYISAARGGPKEDIPLSLVDLDAPTRWENQHPHPGPADPNNPQPSAIDP